MLVIIDSDSIVYGACLSVQGQADKGELIGGEKFLLSCVKKQLNVMVDKITRQTGADEYIMVLSGADNFRYEIYPDYKANRVGMEKPPRFKEAREHLIKMHSAYVTENSLEADDFCHMYVKGYDEGDIIVSHIDKDLDLIVGKHHNFRSGGIYDVDEKQAMHNFYMQFLTGDNADNIYGLSKLTEAVATPAIKKELLEKNTPFECWCYVVDVFFEAFSMYGDVSVEYVEAWLTMNGKCLWLQSRESDIWEPPV